ncbi:hypothetical protein Mal64_03050 [Pseudobythopirellula maris]|uniref:General secretion pathway, M protein n=1 Tax=Pseudobythopirellula maris TaxID=2527991 RepID=A0A5C5ZUP3_9BACT|nr:hypothetical protein [Pseudobythopirellula maris]TWT89923.1 hypothetical protein Mal64_03050 [Pseudobythopirellula maris]
MDDAPIAKVLLSRKRWIIVAAASLLTGLFTILPQVDERISLYDERSELRHELALASEAAEGLDKLRVLVAAKQAELALLEANTVDETNAPQVRNWFVETARSAGCRLRRLDLGEPSRHAWRPGDNPLEPTTTKGTGKQPYNLETRAITLSATGAADEIDRLVRSLDDDGRWKHIKSFELRPTSRLGEEVQLEVVLLYFALTENDKVA